MSVMVELPTLGNGKVTVAHEPQAAHSAKAKPGYYSIKQLGVLPWMGCWSITGLPPAFVASTHLYVGKERETMWSIVS